MDYNNLLLTGSSGFLGSVIKKHFEKAESGMKIHTLNRFSESTYKIDLARKNFQLMGEGYELVIHSSGKAHSVPVSDDEIKEFFDVNFEGTKSLCNAIDMLPNKPKAFIFISTVAVYGIESGLAIDENHPLEGITPYAKSKILAEQFLTEWAKKNNIKLGILRLPLIAGPNPPGNLGAMIKGIHSGKYLSIGKADARKSMVWVQDIAEIINSLAEVGGIYNLTDGYHPTFKELEITISLACGKREPFSIPMVLASVIGKVGDIIKKFPVNSDKLNKITSTLTFDDTKARNLLGWKPNFVLDKLRDTL